MNRRAILGGLGATGLASLAGCLGLVDMDEHEKVVEIPEIGRQRAAVFVVLTTPSIDVVGYNFNPIEEMSTPELVDLVADSYDDTGDVSAEDDDEGDGLFGVLE